MRAADVNEWQRVVLHRSQADVRQTQLRTMPSPPEALCIHTSQPPQLTAATAVMRHTCTSAEWLNGAERNGTANKTVSYASVFQPFLWSGTLCSYFDCSVQFSYRIYVSRCSLIIKIMTAALTVVTAKKHFSFQPASKLSECQWCRLNFWRQTVPR